MLPRRYSIFLLGLLISGLAITGTVPAQGAIQDITLKDITPKSLLSHSATDIAITGEKLITLGAGNLMVNVYDISDVINPRRIAFLDLPVQGSNICADNNIAFVVCPGYGLVMVDVSDLDNPSITNEMKMSLGRGAGVCADSEHVYLHDGLGTFRVYNRKRPWVLEELGSTMVKGYGDIALSGGYVYFASEGVASVDVSNPSNLRVVETPTPPGSIWGLVAGDGIVCTGDESDMLTIYKAGSDGKLDKISDFEINQTIRDLAIRGKLVGVITADDLITIDITKPEKPSLYGDLPLLCELRKVVSKDGYFFLASELDGPIVADVSERLRQKVIAYQAGLGLVSTIASRGNLMLAGSWDSIRALERREEGEEEIIGIQHSEGFTREMQITGDFAYLADPTRGLRVFNVSRPVFMRPVALLELPGTPSDVELVGELAFVPLGKEGVAQVNIHYPFSPIKRLMIETEHPITNVTRAGDYLYFISPDGYIGIYDITIPTQPRQAAWLALGGLHPIDAQVYGHMMAVSSGTDGLWLFDVSDPIRPVLRSKYVPSGSVETAALFDDGVIVEVKGSGFCKLEVVDLRYIFAPYKRTELMLAERSDYRDQLHVVGDRAYLAAYNYGMKVFEMGGMRE